MLDYNKIKLTIQRKNFSLRHFIPQFTEMTVQGFKLAIKNRTLKVSTLEDISKALNLKMSYWWEDENQDNVINDSQAQYERINVKLVEHLKKELVEDKMKIENLNREIGKLEEKLTHLDSNSATQTETKT